MHANANDGMECEVVYSVAMFINLMQCHEIICDVCHVCMSCMAYVGMSVNMYVCMPVWVHACMSICMQCMHEGMQVCV